MKNIILLLFSFLALSCSKSDNENELEKVSLTFVNNSEFSCDYFCYDSKNEIVKNGSLNANNGWERFEVVKNRHYKVVVYVVRPDALSLKAEKTFFAEKEEIFQLFEK